MSALAMPIRNEAIPAVVIPEGRRGPWRVEKFTVEQNDPGLFYLAVKGRSLRPGTYTRLVHDQRGVVMSDTTAERRDHIGFVLNSRGRVLINGLGLGMCAAAALQRPEVEAVTVVEIDRDVIGLVAPHLNDRRIEIIHASAFDYEPPKGIRYGAVWHDIWDEICADNLPEMHRLHRKYGRRSDWQGSWARELCERGRR